MPAAGIPTFAMADEAVREAKRYRAELEVAARATPRCQSCGATETVRHRNVTLCAYCRGGR